MNKQTLSTKTLSTLKVIILALVLGLGISYAQAVWTGPTAPPTGNNVEAPINVSATAQTKAGNLTAGGLTLGGLFGGSSFISPNGSGSQALYLLGATSGFTGINNQWRWYVSENGDTNQPGKANASDFCINGGGCLGSGGGIPVGGIIMWSGSVANIPSGWKLCDGTNGTPNLTGRFIVGAGSGYAVNALGGSANSIVVSHTHTVTDPGHTHTFNPYPVSTNAGDAGFGQFEANIAYTPKDTSSSLTGISIGAAGSSGVNANLPPYYALAFIMRTL